MCQRGKFKGLACLRELITLSMKGRESNVLEGLGCLQGEASVDRGESDMLPKSVFPSAWPSLS